MLNISGPEYFVFQRAVPKYTDHNTHKCNRGCWNWLRHTEGAEGSKWRQTAENCIMYCAVNVINVVRWAGLGVRVGDSRGFGWINLRAKHMWKIWK